MRYLIAASLLLSNTCIHAENWMERRVELGSDFIALKDRMDRIATVATGDKPDEVDSMSWLRALTLVLSFDGKYRDARMAFAEANSAAALDLVEATWPSTMDSMTKDVGEIERLLGIGATPITPTTDKTDHPSETMPAKGKPGNTSVLKTKEQQAEVPVRADVQDIWRDVLARCREAMGEYGPALVLSCVEIAMEAEVRS